MEAADRSMNELADELDGMIANYTAFATKADVARETALQNEIDYESRRWHRNRPWRLAWPVWRRHPATTFAWSNCSQPYSDVESPQQCELLLDLGDSLCQHYRDSHASPEYERGLDFLKASLALCENGDVSDAPLLRRRDSLHGWGLGPHCLVLEVVEGEAHQAMEKYRHAHEVQPENPYHLAQMLGYNRFFANGGNLPSAMRGTIRRAITRCREHAIAGTELPFAFFTAGRLCLLVDDENEALGYYARGIRHCLAGDYCMPPHVLEHEIAWLVRMHSREEMPRPSRHVIDLLKVGRTIESQTMAAKRGCAGHRCPC